MKKNNILFLSLISGLLCFSAACSDEDDSSLLPPPVDIEGTEGTDNSSITKLAWKETEKTVAFLNESKDIPVNLQLTRTGSSNKDAVNAQLTPLTQEELDAYNTEHKTSYALLPAAYYSLPPTIEVAADVKQQKVDMTIKSSVKDLTDINDRQYAVAVRLTAEGCEIKEGYDFLLIQLKAITPQFSLVEPSGVIGKGDALIVGITGDITKTLNVAMNVDNRWDSKVVFEADPIKLQEWVDVYNQAESKSATLLPADYYTIGTDGKLEFGTADRSNKEVAIVISAKASSTTALSEGEYILPVTLAACEGMPFLVNKETVCYFKFSVLTPQLSLPAGLQAETEVNRGKEIKKEINVNLNTGYQWDTEGKISILSDKAELESLVTKYNSDNTVSYTLLPADSYTLSDLSYTKNDGENKKLEITINAKGSVNAGKYLLPIKISSCDNNFISIADKICYLPFTVTKKLNITEDMVSTNNYEHSIWATMPVSAVVDGYYYNNNDYNGGNWSSAWNDNKDNTSDSRDQTYGVYIDINISDLGYQGNAKLIMRLSKPKDVAKRPKKMQIYTNNDANNDTWNSVISAKDYTASEKTINGKKKGDETLQEIPIYEFETAAFNIAAETRRIRIAFLTNFENASLKETKKAVRLDELELHEE